MSLKLHWQRITFSMAAGLGLAGGACSASSTEGDNVGSYGGGRNGGAGGIGIAGTTGAAGSGLGGIDVGGNTGAGGSGPNCGGDRYEAQKRPLDIYVMFDDSGSMVPWWPGITQAFINFLNDAGSAGIGVGIQYFGSSCNVNDYATPRVPIAPLPGNVGAIQGSLPFIPIESTATHPALTGAVQHARAWANSHPDHKVVILLATDGIPSECDSTLQNVSDVAREGVSGSPSIPTYVLGFGFDLTPLEQIAQAGGTQKAFIVDPASGAALTQAMNAIRGAALPCDYALPNGGNVDPRKVNIDFTPQGGGPTRLSKVEDPASCAPGAWYYDNPDAPTRAVVCPETCGTFNADTGGRVDVVLGCDTVIF